MVQNAKSAFRNTVLASLDALGEKGQVEAGRRAAERLFSLPEYGRALAAALYASTGWEMPTGFIAEELLSRERAVYLPRVCGPGEMLMKRLRGAADLAPGRFGIPEPPADAETGEPESIELWIVPGLAFDERGRRLGRGGGYYDRILTRTGPGALKIGLAHEEQVFGAIPAGPRDVDMDLIVTPERVVEARQFRLADPFGDKHPNSEPGGFPNAGSSYTGGF